MKVPSSTVQALLEKYKIHPPVTDERYLSHAEIEHGVPLRLLCLSDRVFGRRLVVSSKRRRWTCTCPLAAGAAAELAHQLADAGAIPKAYQEVHTLANLLLRCCRLFAGERLQRLYLAPVYVRRNDYRVGGAAMTSAARICAAKRLQPAAHDKGAVFAYRPALRPQRTVLHVERS